MRILIAGDIHNHPAWLEYLEAIPCDLMCFPGDILQAKEPIIPQIRTLQAWIQSLPTACAIASGNHDCNERGKLRKTAGLNKKSKDKAADLLKYKAWMDSLKRPFPEVVTDKESRIVETGNGCAVVSCFPYEFEKSEPTRKKIWDEGKKHKTDFPNYPWIVLHHEPPTSQAIAGAHGNEAFHQEILAHQPDFAFCAHAHDQPQSETGRFFDKLGKTWCFNAGYPTKKAESAKHPNHIRLDLKKKKATWKGTCGREGLTIEETIELA